MSDYSIGAQGDLVENSNTPTYTPSTNWSLYTFIGLTFVFFYLKYNTDINLYNELNKQGLPSLLVFKNSMIYFLIYFFIVFILQVSASAIQLNGTCPNNESNNFMSAVLYCFGPWVFIFLVMVIILIRFPFIKKAFTDVIGYAIVSRTINNIFSQVLYSSQELKERIGNIESKTQKQEIMLADEAIMKIVQDNSVFVNQIGVQNFNQFWDSLKPLMKNDDEDLKKELFKQVIRKDNWGEMFWYLYTGIFVSFVVAYNVSVKSCKESVEQLKKDFVTDIPTPNSGKPKEIYV
jgi:hypothetical protein